MAQTPDETSSGFPRAPRLLGSPPWWVVVVFGAAITASFAVAGWAAQGIVSMRIEQERMNASIDTNAREVARVDANVRALPVRADLESMRSEISGLREDMREMRDEVRRMARVR